MYDYMRALEDRFNSTAKADPQRRELEAKRQQVAALLDKEGRKKLLRLVDAHTAAQEETALDSFIAGFRLAWGIAMELALDGSYSYQREWAQLNRLKHDQEGVEPLSKRRPSGDGMVRKREDGRWEGRIVVGHKEDGESIFRYLYADTQKELTAKLRQNIDLYQGIDLTEQSRMTLEEWLERWLGQMSATLRPGTLEHYRKDMENHVVPQLGAKMLTQLTAAYLRRLYDTLKRQGRLNPRPGQARGLSSTTVRNIHATIHQALRAAAEQGLIPRNPADEVDPPKVVRQPMKILNEEQLDIFMEAIKEEPIWHDFFYTELTTGLRLGEICGLMWTDLDGKAGTLQINRTLHKEKGGRLVAGDTKTYAGTRKIVLPPSAAQLLRDRKKNSFSPWIFHDPLRPEAPVNPSSAYYQLKKLLVKAGLPDIRFHDLRHTFSSHALASGVDAKTLSGILGHTKASFTLDTYTHTTSDMHRRAADIVGGFLTDYLGEEMKPWQNAENGATAE